MKKGKIIVSLLLSIVLTVSVLFIGVSAEDKYAAGDLVTLGTYPQSMVTDEQLITELNSLPLDWVSYGYYYWYYINPGSIAYEMKSAEQDWMKYVDVEHGGEKYRGVLIEEYRQLMNPYYQDIAGQKDYGFELNKIYWFKFEPLIWRVIDPEEGILISEYVIDSQQINEKYYYSCREDIATTTRYTDTGRIILHVDDYSLSSLRSWLNETFVNTAFSNEEQELLISRELNNKPTRFSGEICEYSDYGYNYKYYYTTTDKVSLLSVGELLEWRDNIGTLEAVSTDYSYSQGRQVNTPEWTLRTPIFNTLEYANLHNVNPLFVGCDTCPAVRVYYDDFRFDSSCAVCKSEERYGWPLLNEFFYQIPALRPVIKIDLDSAELSPEEPTTEEPTTEEPTTEEPTTEEPTTEDPTTEEPTTEEPTTEEPTTEEPTTEEPTTEEPTTEEPTTEEPTTEEPTTEEPTTEEPTTEEPTTEEPTTEEPTTEEPTTEEPTTEESTTEEPTTEESTTEESTTEEPPAGNDGESFFARLWNFLVRIYRYIVNVFKTIFGIE